MLDLHNILWVVPGVVFINFYNRRRPSESIMLSGWPYLFFLVVIAALSWLPSEWIMLKASGWTDAEISNPAKQAGTLIISLIVTFFWVLISQWEPIANIIFAPAQDNFYRKCIEWENQAILLTLKNSKIYIGVLWKFSENPKSRHESQTISIIPMKSGYRDKNTKKAIWNTDYKEAQDKAHLIDMEVIIPRSEIVTFRKFKEEVFDYFHKDI